jgi:cobalt-zinc-cadmium efflux system outer membrane protein
MLQKFCVPRAVCFLAGLLVLLQTLVLQAAENTLRLPETASTLFLSAAVKRALAENPSLKVFEFRREALSGELSTAGLRPGYELGFNAENFAGSGDLNGFDEVELTVALSSTIEMGGKRDARLDVVSRERRRVDSQMQVEALELLGEVTRRYIDVLAAQERVSLAIDANELAQGALAEVTKRAAAGATPEAEVKRAQAAAAQAHLTVSSEQNQLDYLQVALVSLWGETTPEFTAVEGDLYRFGEDVDFDVLFARVEQNPAVLVFAAEKRLKESELRLAKTQASTDVRWSVGLRQFQEVDDTAVVAGFSMPLFAGSRGEGAIRSATAARNEVTVRKEFAILTLRTQLYRAFSNRRQAIHTANDLRKDIVPALEQALLETQHAYQRGRYSYSDYVTARQELLSARRTLIDAATAALRYGADIEQLTAQPLSSDQYPQDFQG